MLQVPIKKDSKGNISNVKHYRKEIISKIDVEIKEWKSEVIKKLTDVSIFFFK